MIQALNDIGFLSMGLITKEYVSKESLILVNTVVGTENKLCTESLNDQEIQITGTVEGIVMKVRVKSNQVKAPLGHIWMDLNVGIKFLLGRNDHHCTER